VVTSTLLGEEYFTVERSERLAWTDVAIMSGIARQLP
jgi:hypothetical protein